MERQRHVCVIDWFGVNYDGTMPTILLACDENSCSLSGRAAKSPALESADCAGRAKLFLSIKFRNAPKLERGIYV